MSRRSVATIPKPAAEELRKLGSAVRAARLARNETQASLARRIGTSLKTLRAIEMGDPRVGSGTLISAFWALGFDPIGDVLVTQAAKSVSLTGKKRARGTPSRSLDDF